MNPRKTAVEEDSGQEVIMLYKEGEPMRKITDRSRVQRKLWDVFPFEQIETRVLLHESAELIT